MPARSMSRMASDGGVVLRLLEPFGSGMRQMSMRTRGTVFDSISRFTSQSGCG